MCVSDSTTDKRATFDDYIGLFEPERLTLSQRFSTTKIHSQNVDFNHCQNDEMKWKTDVFVLQHKRRQRRKSRRQRQKNRQPTRKWKRAMHERRWEKVKNESENNNILLPTTSQTMNENKTQKNYWNIRLTRWDFPHSFERRVLAYSFASVNTVNS